MSTFVFVEIHPDSCASVPRTMFLFGRLSGAQEELKELLEDAGFCCVSYRNLSGGVVSLHSGFKL